MAAIAGRFARVEPRRAARAFVTGLLSPLDRKTCWSLAEQAGHRSPDRMQRLLHDAVWDTDAVRGDVRDLAVAGLEHPDAVLVPDETGDLKKGDLTVGTQRQYSGTAGRIENAQVSVLLAYASPRGRAAIDHRLYLPASWTNDRDRCAAAGVPDSVQFATKPQLAAAMIDDAVAAGVRARWVAADEAYGNDAAFRARLQAHRLGYVLAVSCNHLVPIDGGKTRRRADTIAAHLPDSAWHTMSAGTGSKGPRDYQWAWLNLQHHNGESVLIRRHPGTGELAYYRCWTPKPQPLAALVRVAGMRWMVEETIQAGKGQTGLDEHQVRHWTSWQRFTTLALLALAILALCAADSTPADQPDPNSREHPCRPTLIPLTVNELRRLFNTFFATTHTIAHQLHWSTWRRRHQATARTSHYQRRLTAELSS
jgi:SRSO17 transposase